MKKSFAFFVLLSLGLFSCGKTEETEIPVEGNDNPYAWNQAMKKSEEIKGDELKIARRICESFVDKRLFLARQARGLVMDFRVSAKTCSQDSADVTPERTQGRIKASRTGTLSMDSLDPVTPVFDDVLSDEHPKISPFCSKINANEVTENTVRRGATRLQVNFFKQVDRDWIQVVEFQENSADNKFYPYLIERSSIVTPDSSPASDDQLGFVTLRAINRPCSNNSSQFILQEWL